jgi:hypothetical protein
MIGFQRIVNLSEEKQAEIAQIIFDVTGIEADELIKIIEAEQKAIIEEYSEESPMQMRIFQERYAEIIPIKVTYDEYKEKIKETDKILGGKYNQAIQSSIQDNVPMTYEEKLAEYNAFMNEDKITGAYARLFTDYMMIIAGMLSMFAPVAFLMRDKRAKSDEIIFSRDMSSAKFIITRYAALVFMMFIPFVIIMHIPAVQLIQFAFKNNLPVDVFAFLKYTVWWILPTLMTHTAFAFLITVIAENPLAIFLQFGWGFINLITGFFGALAGGTGELVNVGFNLIIRCNTDSLQIYKNLFGQLMLNRLFYTILSIAVIAMTILIYEKKRRGEIDVKTGIRDTFKKIFGSHKSTV